MPALLRQDIGMFERDRLGTITKWKCGCFAEDALGDRWLFECNGFICGYAGDLDPVQGCDMVAGGFDYLLKVRTADMDSYRRILEQLAALSGVEQTHTYVVMEEVKSTRSVPLDDR